MIFCSKRFVCSTTTMIFAAAAESNIIALDFITVDVVAMMRCVRSFFCRSRKRRKESARVSLCLGRFLFWFFSRFVSCWWFDGGSLRIEEKAGHTQIFLSQKKTNKEKESFCVVRKSATSRTTTTK